MENIEKKRIYESLDLLFAKALQRGIFSGAAAAVFHQEKRLVRCCGKTRNDGRGIAVDEDTLFDLASLTKPLCTLPGILWLIERKIISRQTTIGDIFSDYPAAACRDIRLEQVLSHSGGLKEYEPYYSAYAPRIRDDNKDRLLAAILGEDLIYKAGTKCAYSDLGYILLGEAIERLSGMRIDRLFTEHIAAPLGLEDEIFFRPVTACRESKRYNIAATEYCPWRARVIQGEVHDENCWLMNGVAGHAGLFATIGGVLKLTGHLLGQWQGKLAHPAFSKRLLQECMHKPVAGHTWYMGFDSPSAGGSSAGKYMYPNSAGHLGFTGTSFWMDRDRDMVIVLLTNRVHPSRRNEEIKTFRPQFHDLVMQTII